MDLLSKLRKVEKIRFYAGLILVGLILTVLSCIGLFTPHGEYLPVEATVVDKEERITSDKDTEYIFYIDYTVNGKTYSHVEFSAFDSKTEIGDKVTIEYDEDNPENIQSVGGGSTLYVVLAAGVLALGFGLAKIGSAIKQPAAELDEFHLADARTKAAETQKAAAGQNAAEEADPLAFTREIPTAEPTDWQPASFDPEPRDQWESFYYHYTGKMNQSRILETRDGRKEACYAEQIKMTALKPYIYEFRSRRTLKNVTREIGHPVSVTTGSSFGFRIPIKKSFTIDGQNNWEFLADRGYTIDMELQGLKPCFTVKRNGTEVAYIETAGTNILKDGSDFAAGKIPVNGLYKVDCAPSEADGVFMVCFCLDFAFFLAD